MCFISSKLENTYILTVDEKNIEEQTIGKELGK